VQNGVVLSYVHNQAAPGLGKIGVLVALESGADPGKLAAAGKPLALHVAAANPLFLDRGSVPASALERERQIQIDRARQEGTPEDIAVKKVEGRLQKEYFKENVLLEQVSVMDNKTPIQKVVEQIGKEAGAPVKIAGYVRFALGEGIEKKEEDFAAEVAAQLKPKD
jgi:elongation factor Ts